MSFSNVELFLGCSQGSPVCDVLLVSGVVLHCVRGKMAALLLCILIFLLEKKKKRRKPPTLPFLSRQLYIEKTSTCFAKFPPLCCSCIKSWSRASSQWKENVTFADSCVEPLLQIKETWIIKDVSVTAVLSISIVVRLKNRWNEG